MPGGTLDGLPPAGHRSCQAEQIGGTAETRIVEVAEQSARATTFPTDERSRASDLFWRPIVEGVAGEAEPWRHLYRFRDPYRHEVDIEATHLPSGATHRVVIDEPDARGPIEVALFYKRSPYWLDPDHPNPDAEADLVHLRLLEP